MNPNTLTSWFLGLEEIASKEVKKEKVDLTVKSTTAVVFKQMKFLKLRIIIQSKVSCIVNFSSIQETKIS